MLHSRTFFALLVCVAAALTSNVAEAKRTLKPPKFSPTGAASDVRQAVARFSEPMVRLGDLRAAESPFDIDCAAPGNGVWLDSRTWAFNFDKKLEAGVQCRFTVREGLQSLDGDPIGAGEGFSFSTGGPRILSSDPSTTSAIPEDAVFVLQLDGKAVTESVEQHAYFTVEGIGERVGVRVLSGDQRQAVLATLPPSARAGPLVILQARQSFPANAKVELVWAKGVETPSGVERGKNQSLSFRVRKAFHATLTCRRDKANQPCMPLGAVRLEFSAPVAWENARGATLVDPESGLQRKAESWRGDGTFTRGLLFAPPIPVQADLELRLGEELRDDSGRVLENATQFPMRVQTGPLPPLAKFAARFGILEANADPALPVTVRSLGPKLKTKVLDTTTLDGNITRVGANESEEVLPWLRRVNAARRTQSIFTSADGKRAGKKIQKLELPLPGEAGETEVLGIPLEKPGLYVVEIESAPLGRALLGKRKPMYVSAAALVTNLAVHLKHGFENSLVWVTTLDEAKPASGADVQVYDCSGKLLASAKTNPQGVARLKGVPPPDQLPWCTVAARGKSDPWRGWRGSNAALDGINSGLFVTARLGQDLSFAFSSWDGGLEPWRFGVSSSLWGLPSGLHTVFDRTLLRAGDTLHMKHILRMETDQGFALPPPEKLPTRASLRHVGSDTTIEMPLHWANDGSAINRWAIPPSAKLGRYEVFLTSPTPPPPEGANEDGAKKKDPRPGELTVGRRDPQTLSGRSGSFRVEEFRVPLMQATVKLPAEPQVAPTEISADIALRYLAGGGAGNIDVLVRSEISPYPVKAPRTFADLTFGNGPVVPGLKREPRFTTTADAATIKPRRQEVELDLEGTARIDIDDLPEINRPSRLTAEVEYRDPNGEAQTTAASVPLWPAERIVGLNVTNWVRSTGRLRIETAVIDPNGKAVAGADVEVRAYARRDLTTRKRIVGGFYSYESVQETTALDTVCQGKTDAQGRFVCRQSPPQQGQLLIEARTADSDARTSTAHQSVWIWGSQRAWFRPSDTDRMELRAEAQRYQPGETARIQVRTPFSRSLALITVEREGILETRVEELSGVEPVVEVPISKDLAPNAYVSVLAVRGRRGQPQPTALVDLGKPTFRLGLTQIEVGWRSHQLDVEVTTDKSVYHVRETAKASISVRDAKGQPPPPGSEVAIAAVDEGLLALVPNKSWALLRAMMGERSLRVTTSTAQMQVIGKRHFGRKALPEGGGGGQKPTRELFDTLLLWNGRLALDAEGNASVDIPLNDSLSSFRIVAVATGGVGLFGTGKTSIRATQDLMVFSGLPPVVRIGDEFGAGFTIRNTTNRTIDVQLTARVQGLGTNLQPREARLASGEARTMDWEIQVPGDVEELTWEVEARDTRSNSSDRLRVTQIVEPAVPVRTRQATMAQWDPTAPLSEPVALPPGALPNRGEVEVTLARSLSDGLTGVRQSMRDYPYTCLEQQVSKAIVSGDEAQWAALARNLSSYTDDDGLLKFFPSLDRGSAVLTAYVIEIATSAGRPLPQPILKKLTNALVSFVEGRTRDAGARTSLTLEKLAALSALARIGRVQAGLLTGLTIEPEAWPTTTVVDWWNTLLALPDLAGRTKKLRATEKVLRGRLYEQGTTLVFENADSGGPSLLANGTTDTLRLVFLLLENGLWKEELPKLLQGSLSLQSKGAWSTTVANAWGMLALTKFSQAFEAEPITGSTSVSLAGHTQQIDWLAQPRGRELEFAWPSSPSTLSFAHEGTGKPWILSTFRAAVPLTQPISNGFQIRKSTTATEPRSDGTLHSGDVIEVKIDVTAETAQGWIVIDDPVPAGASFLGRGFASDTRLTSPSQSASGPRPAFVERSFQNYRAYFESVGAETFSVTYQMRLNQAGLFHPPPTRVESLYEPATFGELPQAAVRIEP